MVETQDGRNMESRLMRTDLTREYKIALDNDLAKAEADDVHSAFLSKENIDIGGVSGIITNYEYIYDLIFGHYIKYTHRSCDNE
jgi:hypothetical protein